MTDVVANFAVPSHDTDLERQTAILVRAYAAATAKLIARRGGADPAMAPLVVAMIDATRGVAQPAMLWSPELGAARAHVRADRPDAAAAQFALLLLSTGNLQSFESELSTPTHFLCAGTSFTLDGRVAAEANENMIRLDTPTQKFTLRNHGAGWRLDPLPAAATGARAATNPAPVSGSDGKYVMALASNPNIVNGVEVDRGDLLSALDPDGNDFAVFAAAQMAKAFKLIDSAAPRFSRYVRLLLRGIGAMPIGSVGRTSGSSTEYLGIFSCSLPAVTDWLAESLVHESAHQYHYVLDAALPMTRADDGKRYFSAIKGKPRTLGRQIIGYHAVANIVLFRRALIDVLGPTATLREELERFEGYANEMRRELDGGTTYTDEGRAFVVELNRNLDCAA
jgi:HEXXH motif-containing protein